MDILSRWELLSDSAKILVAAIAFCVFLIVPYVVYYYIAAYWKKKQERYRQIVRETSSKLYTLWNINADFADLEFVRKKYAYTFNVNSRQAAEHLNFHKNILDLIAGEAAYHEQILDTCQRSSARYREYLQELEYYAEPIDIPGDEELARNHISEKKYIEIENELYTKDKYSTPVMDPQFIYTVSYVSPKGRSSYSTDVVYSIHNSPSSTCHYEYYYHDHYTMTWRDESGIYKSVDYPELFGLSEVDTWSHKLIEEKEAYQEYLKNTKAYENMHVGQEHRDEIKRLTALLKQCKPADTKEKGQIEEALNYSPQ